MSEVKQDKYIREVTTTSTGKEVTKYKLNGTLVKGAEVSDEVKNGLANLPVGEGVDVNGMPIAPASTPEGDAPSAPTTGEGSEGEDDDLSLDDIDDADDSSEEDSSEDAPEDGAGDDGEADEDEEEELPPAPVVDPKAEKAAQKVAKAQPSTPEDLDAAAEAGAPKPVKPVKVPDTARDDEKPGGPQEPAVANPTLDIDSPDDVDDESGDDVEEQARIRRATAGQEIDEAGMGFKRVNGKTVDVFDGKTPHTHVRFVANIMVPLTKENFEKRSDGEIIDKLRELGKVA